MIKYHTGKLVVKCPVCGLTTSVPCTYREDPGGWDIAPTWDLDDLRIDDMVQDCECLDIIRDNSTPVHHTKKGTTWPLVDAYLADIQDQCMSAEFVSNLLD